MYGDFLHVVVVIICRNKVSSKTSWILFFLFTHCVTFVHRQGRGMRTHLQVCTAQETMSKPKILVHHRSVVSFCIIGL